MPLISLIGLIYAVPCAILALSVLLRRQNSLHFIWGLLNLLIGVCGACLFFVGYAHNEKQAIIAWKLTHICFMLIPALFYHVVYIFLGLNKKRVLFYVYLQTLFLISVIGFTSYAIANIKFLFGSIYFNTVTPFYCFMFILWCIIPYLAFKELSISIRAGHGVKSIQTKYLIVGGIFGFGGGASTILPAFGIMLYPVGQLGVGIYVLISAFAVLKYQLLDIKIAITRVGLFIFVYALVLGIPFFFGYKYHQWQISTWAMLVLATAGPFIFFYLQRRAEWQILREEKRVYNLIKKASAGIVGIRDMQKLLDVLVVVLKNNLFLEHISIYLFDSVENVYALKATNPDNNENVTLNNNLLFERLKKTKRLVFYDEMLHLSDNSKNGNEEIREIVSQMQKLSAAVVIPAVKEDTLLAFIVLGKRQGKEVFSTELLDVLSVVGNEFALAIEIILSLIERDKLLNENSEIRRFESIGLFYNSLSHQMNNRFHSIESLIFNPIDIYSEGKYKQLKGEEQNKELMDLVEDFAQNCKKVDAVAKEGGELTRVILNFSRGKMEFGVVKFDELVTQSLKFLELKYPQFKYDLRKEYPNDVLLWGSSLSIKDLIYNAVDNSCYAMQTKQARGGEYKPVVIIRGKLNETMFHFEIEDNGTGIKKENVNKVMDPMYSTKGHNQGSGVGTTFMREIVLKHKGTIVYDSEWDQWTKVRISLPLATKEQKGV